MRHDTKREKMSAWEGHDMMGRLLKKFLFVLLGSSFFLSACRGAMPKENLSHTGVLPDTAAEVYEAYAAVLLEDAAFFDAATQAYGQLSDYIPLPFENLLFNTGNFCTADIDWDGIDEVFLQYDLLDSYLALDYEDGVVYGYCFYPPALVSLRYHLQIYENAGPCIEIRGENASYYNIRFSHGSYELIQIPEPDLESGKGAAWYAFTQKNVLQVFLPKKLETYLAEQERLATEWAADHKEEGEAWDAFRRVLNGDFTLIADVEARHLLSDAYWENLSEHGACTWQYVLLEDSDGRQSLFIQDDTYLDGIYFSALLYYDAGKLICAALDAMDFHDYYIPLQDGRLLYVYHYYPTIDECIIRIDADFEHVTESEYNTIYIDYDLYETREEPYSRYHDFADHYDVITGMGEYYFVTEYANGTALDQTAISLQERWETERQLDGLLVPDYAWKSCPEKTDPVLLNLEKLFGEYNSGSWPEDFDFLYAGFEKSGETGAFAFIGSILWDYYEKPHSYPFMMFSGSVWYVDAQGCTLLAEKISTDSYEPTIILQADECHLLYTTAGRYYSDAGYIWSDTSYIWTVREGKPLLLLETPGFCTVENDRLLCFPSAEAALEADIGANEADAAANIRCFSYDTATGTYQEVPLQ